LLFLALGGATYESFSTEKTALNCRQTQKAVGYAINQTSRNPTARRNRRHRAALMARPAKMEHKADLAERAGFRPRNARTSRSMTPRPRTIETVRLFGLCGSSPGAISCRQRNIGVAASSLNASAHATCTACDSQKLRGENAEQQTMRWIYGSTAIEYVF
jgi:hypothetical protein